MGVAGELDAHQRKLALRALQRRDYLRAAVLGIKAIITRLCHTEGSDPLDYRARDAADKAFGAQLRDGEHTDWKRDAYWTLKTCATRWRTVYRRTSGRMRNCCAIRSGYTKD